jgi:hypothetical protein
MVSGGYRSRTMDGALAMLHGKGHDVWEMVEECFPRATDAPARNNSRHR